MHQVAVHGELFDGPVGVVENGHAGGFVNAAALHPHEAVFHQSIRPTPLRPPIAFKSATIWKGVRGWPFKQLGMPSSKPTVTVSTASGVFWGETVMPNSTSSTAVDVGVLELARLVADVQAVFVGAVRFGDAWL